MTAGAATVPAGKCECGHFAPVGEVTACARCDCPRHVASPYQGHDPQTPPGAEAAVAAFMAALDGARRELARAVDEEVDAELARDAARDDRMLSAGCPRVRRDVCTVAERDAWVRREVRAEERAYRAARARRLAAQQFLAVLGKKLSGQQTIAKSVDGSYRGQRGDGW